MLAYFEVWSIFGDDENDNFLFRVKLLSDFLCISKPLCPLIQLTFAIIFSNEAVPHPKSNITGGFLNTRGNLDNHFNSVMQQ